MDAGNPPLEPASPPAKTEPQTTPVEPKTVPVEPTPGETVTPSPQPRSADAGTERRRKLAAVRARVDTQKEALGARAEAIRSRHRSVQLAFETYERDRRQAGGLLAGGLAFRFFLWLLPTAVVLVSVIGLVAQIGEDTAEVVAERAGLGAALASVVSTAAEQSGRSSFVLLILGLWLMTWAGMSAIKALRILAGAAWRIGRPRLSRPIVSGLAFSGVGIAILVLPSVLGILHAGPFATDLLVELAMSVAAGAVFIWASWWLPHPEGVRWVDLVPGAVVVAVGAGLLRLITAIYLVGRMGRVDDLYGAFGLSAVFLTWLYLIGRLLVAGMALNATRWRDHERRAQAGPAEPAGDPEIAGS